MLEIEGFNQSHHPDLSSPQLGIDTPPTVGVSDDHEPTFRTEYVVLERCASEHIWLARKGVPGMYVVYPDEGEETYFLVTAVCLTRPGRGQGKTAIRVFPMSFWKNGNCQEEVPLPSPDARQPFLPSRVLWGNCDPDRLPDTCRDRLENFVEDINSGVRYYDEVCRRQRRARRD